jgi:hypothetical protein
MRAFRYVVVGTSGGQGGMDSVVRQSQGGVNMDTLNKSMHFLPTISFELLREANEKPVYDCDY